jgi:hypothetical protein
MSAKTTTLVSTELNFGAGKADCFENDVGNMAFYTFIN